MTKNDERLPRLLALLPWLRSHPGVTVDEAAAQFDITETQLRSDVELLWFCGLPGLGPSDLIDVEFEGDTIRVVDAQTLDRPLRLTGNEGQALLAAARALREVPGLVDTEALDSVIDKLRGAVATVRPADEVRAPMEAVAVSVAAGNEDPAVTVAVRAALAGGQMLRLRYLVERRDEITDRTVSPLQLRLVDGRVYLHAFDTDRQALRLFRLDRVLAAEVLDEPARTTVRSVSDDDELFHAAPEDIEVTLDLSARARWVADSYPTESAVEQPGGAVRIVLRTPDTGWLVRLVLRLGGAATVVGPPAVLDDVRSAARAGLDGYAPA